MSNAKPLLVSFLSIASLNGCAGAYKVTDDKIFPPRPSQEVCIADGGTGAECFDDRKRKPEYHRDSILNYICTNPKDDRTHEAWLRYYMKSCGEE